MKYEKIKQLTSMCDHKIYWLGDAVDMKTGGILLRGGLKRKSVNFDVKITSEKMDPNYKS